MVKCRHPVPFLFRLSPFPPPYKDANHHPTPQRSVYKAQIQPLRKKLNKCRDPERWNLVELQRARREQAAKRADSEDGEPDDRGDTLDDDGAVFGGGLPAKRRKVAGGLEDPFGPPL